METNEKNNHLGGGARAPVPSSKSAYVWMYIEDQGRYGSQFRQPKVY